MAADEVRSIRERARELANYSRDRDAAYAYIEQHAIYAGDEPTGDSSSDQASSDGRVARPVSTPCETGGRCAPT